MKLHANVFDTAAYMHCFTQQRIESANANERRKCTFKISCFVRMTVRQNIQGEQKSQLIANEILFSHRKALTQSNHFYGISYYHGV